MPGHYVGCPLTGDLLGIPVPIYPKRVRTHLDAMCAGEYCVIHRPSNHHMRCWPINIRLDRFGSLAERICKHGIGHPDPDSLTFVEGLHPAPQRGYEGVHGCDGCCGTALPPEFSAKPPKASVPELMVGFVKYLEEQPGYRDYWSSDDLVLKHAKEYLRTH